MGLGDFVKGVFTRGKGNVRKSSQSGKSEDMKNEGKREIKYIDARIGKNYGNGRVDVVFDREFVLGAKAKKGYNFYRFTGFPEVQEDWANRYRVGADGSMRIPEKVVYDVVKHRARKAYEERSNVKANISGIDKEIGDLLDGLSAGNGKNDSSDSGFDGFLEEK